MRLNFKQQELIDNLVHTVESKFPGVKFVDVTESPEDPDDLWVNVTKIKDSDKLMELFDYCSEMSADILMNYGYHMLVMPVK
ncbi:MAG: hypothetical protein WCR46_20045 [Deltaproteobacteria bacterium]|jgi:hypothetical protein